VKRDTLILAVVVAGLLLIGGDAAAALPKRKENDVDDGQALVKRAGTGYRWARVFEAAGASAALAAGLSRWVGIESGGNPLAVSRLGERGLLQALPTTRKSFFSDAEWAELGDAATTDERHAALALKELAWITDQAAKRTTSPLDRDDVGTVLFFSKMYHQRPKDLYDVKLPGDGRAANALLALAWGPKAPNSDHRRKAAAVVAWGYPGGPVNA
jgi:hypothetical protein